jgi:hypothetical protein
MSPHQIKSRQNKSNLNSLAFGFKLLDTNTCGTALTSRPFLPIYGYSEGALMPTVS